MKILLLILFYDFAFADRYDLLRRQTDEFQQALFMLILSILLLRLWFKDSLKKAINDQKNDVANILKILIVSIFIFIIFLLTVLVKEFR